MEKNTQDELLAKKELEHKRKAREIASAKRQKMKSLGLKSINTWLGLEEIEFINKYRDRYALPTLSDALYEIVKQAAIDDTKHRVYLDDLSKKIIVEFSKDVEMPELDNATNHFIKAVSFIKKQSDK